MILDWFVQHKRFGKFRKIFNRPALSVRPLGSFPRTIHLYWDQGFDSAPELVKACLKSWRRHNPGWELKLWDRTSADSIVPFSGFPAGLKVTPYSDILRTELMVRFGGVWADSTLYCTRGLDSWLLQVMAQCDFFAFTRPGPDREIASWFLASRPGSRIARHLSEAIERFWKRQESPTRVYHWFQYIFEYCDRTSAEFRRAWRDAPRLSAKPMLAMQEHLAEESAPSPDEIQLLRAMPMHKLTHKRPIDTKLVEKLIG